jgi:hypothetical protein
MQPSSATNASSTTTSSTIGTATKKPDSSKPGTSTPRVTSPRQEANPHFDTPLRMHDFYKADPIFKQLGATLKQSGANADTRKLLAGFASTMESIRKTVLEAEKLFTPHSRKDCALRLEASKANQVRWLVEIDAVADTILPAKRRGEIHDACVELGRALSKMLVQAKALERAGFADHGPGGRRVFRHPSARQPDRGLGLGPVAAAGKPVRPGKARRRVRGKARHRQGTAAVALVGVPPETGADRVLAGWRVPPARPAGVSAGLARRAVDDPHALSLTGPA